MRAASAIAVLLLIFVSMPIWFYILYKILVAINAGELVWFLFWIYVPVSMLSSAIIKIVKDNA